MSDDKTILKIGDIVKIDFGVHVDHYPVVIAHTIQVGLES
jgi:methionine aminopeptidase